MTRKPAWLGSCSVDSFADADAVADADVNRDVYGDAV
jgi:hypothetical protein